MLENILTLMQQLGVITLALTGGAIFLLARHLIKEHAHELAIKRAKDALDRLAKTLAYAQLSADTSVVSRKHLRSFWQIRRDFRTLAKQRNLYCEQGASTPEWNDFATACATRSETLTEVIDLASDEIYWAKLAKTAHKQAAKSLACFESPQGLKVDLGKAEKNLLQAQNYLGQRQYLKSWEQSKLVHPLIELCTEESKLNELICSLDRSKCSCPGDQEIFDAAKLSLESALKPEAEDSDLDNIRRRLKRNRIKLEILASETPLTDSEARLLIAPSQAERK